MNNKTALILPVLIITLGTGWLLMTLGIAPKIDWIWTLGLAVIGLTSGNEATTRLLLGQPIQAVIEQPPMSIKKRLELASLVAGLDGVDVTGEDVHRFAPISVVECS